MCQGHFGKGGGADATALDLSLCLEIMDLKAKYF